MKKAAILLAVGAAITLTSVSTFSTAASALCNEICQAKCKLGWQPEFKSRKECVVVWSRRNGPTGRGCGTPGGRYERCE